MTIGERNRLSPAKLLAWLLRCLLRFGVQSSSQEAKEAPGRLLALVMIGVSSLWGWEAIFRLPDASGWNDSVSSRQELPIHRA